MIVFDTEDNSHDLLSANKSGFDKQVSQLAAITDTGKRHYQAGNVQPMRFLKWCLETGHTDIWAFNAQYDIGNLCHKEREPKLPDFDQTLVKGRFIKAKIMGLNFYDVHNLSGAGSSVATLGLAVDLPKFGWKYTEKELAKFSPGRQKEIFEWFKMTRRQYLDFLTWKPKRQNELIGRLGKFEDKRYVFRDCEIPMAWLKFIQEQCQDMGLERIPATLGGLCTKTFAALGHQNWFEASDDTAAALTGARVELFSGGGSGRILYVDVNSLYPWCMTQLFPTCVEKLPRLEGYGIAKVDIKIPKMRVAPLPVKEETGRLIFPVGRFGGVWTIHEIKNAVACGAKVLKTHWILGSPDGKPYYRDYITTMYENRQASRSEAERLFWKLLMNNLYGRLAIGGVISRTLNLTEENFDKGIPYGNKVLMDHQMPLPEFTNYLHAAYVLSYARLRLFSFLKLIPPDDLIYCDTDSVFFFCKNQPPFPISADLGQMKLEKELDWCKPWLPKTYASREAGKNDFIYKAKGVPKSQAQAFIEQGKAVYDLPFKLREAIRYYEKDNSRKLSVWRKVEKILAAKYDRKRICGNYFLPKRVDLL